MEKNIHSITENESQWGQRVPVSIDPDNGLIKAGEASRPVDLNADVSLALSSYLSMVYELRSMTAGVIPLRNEDLEALADAFEMDETDVAERLARLMHCDDLQTRRFVQMVKKGRVLVPVSMVAAGALLAVTLTFTGPANLDNTVGSTQTKANVELLAPQVVENTAPVIVELGEAQQVSRAEVVDESPSEPAPQDTPVVEEPEPIVTQNEPDIQIGEGISISRED